MMQVGGWGCVAVELRGCGPAGSMTRVDRRGCGAVGLPHTTTVLKQVLRHRQVVRGCVPAALSADSV